MMSKHSQRFRNSLFPYVLGGILALFCGQAGTSMAADENGAISVVVGRDASPVERSAAEELCGYLGQLYPRQPFRLTNALPERGRAILLGIPSRDDRLKSLLAGQEVSKAESYLVTTKTDGSRKLGLIAGADPRGVVYGVYGLLEKLGCGFYLSGDALPEAKKEDFSFAPWNLSDAPLVRERIVFNWHNFLSGCSTWNLDHWKQWILQSQKGGYNAIMVHAYGNNPMAAFKFNGKQKPVGYLSTTAKGRDWATMHVNDVRRLWGGEVFDGPVFGADAAMVPEEQRVAAAQKLMQEVFGYARQRAMDVYFAVDVDTAPANSPEVVESLPPEARFRVKVQSIPYMGQGGGSMWLPNPDAPEGYQYYKTQVAALLETYPQMTCLLMWFRSGGGVPWMSFRREEMPAAWQEEYRAELAKTPGAAKYEFSHNLFALGKVARAFQRALKELGREDVELGTGSWGFLIVPGVDRFFPREVKMLPLDANIIRNNSQLETAPQRKEIRDAAAHRRMVPIIWAHHDDGHYFGRSYKPFENFHTKLADSGASGFGIIHWLTRPLDIYFTSSSKQVWQRTQNQPLSETCREMAERRFGVSAGDVLGRYLERWTNEAPLIGRETRKWFLHHPLIPLEKADPKNHERRELLSQVDAALLSPGGRVQLDYQRNLEQFLEDFHTTHYAFEQAQEALSKKDVKLARQTLRPAQPENVIEQFVRMCKLGGPSRGEQGLVVSLNLRWLVHVMRLRQALGEGAVRLNFAPNQHEPMAQGSFPFTYFVDKDRQYWDCLGEEETGASVFVLPENTALALPEGLPESYKEICRTGIEGGKEYTFQLKPIHTALAVFQKPYSAVPPGKYRVRLLFVEPTARAAGERVMEVALDDAAKIPSERIDIFRETGGRNRILERVYDVEVGMAGAVKVTVKPIAGKILLCGAVLETQPDSLTSWWLARSRQTEPKIVEWAKKHPDLVSLESQKTFGGRTVYAVTVTNRKLDDGPKRKLLISQPHAHEPAGTAGMMDVLSQLIEGVDLSGGPTAMDRKRILDRAVITFIPDGNPDGRAAAPVEWWDGAAYSNDQFLKLAFGEENGKRSKRVARWRVGQRNPSAIGFAYERINDREYVEPNRDLESTYFKLVLCMHARYSYGLHLDLHQTEFERSEVNCQVFVPFLQKQLLPAIGNRNLEFGRAIIAAWKKAGGRPAAELVPLKYGEDQVQYFRKCWSEIYQKTPSLLIEVQNNHPRTPPRMQMELMEASVVAAIEEILSEEVKTRS